MIQSAVGKVDLEKTLSETKIDVVVGGPPCQPFSKSAQWTRKGARGLADPRTQTIADFIEVISRVKPKAFILENVEGFDKLGGTDALQAGLARLRVAGLHYTLSHKILNGADFGAPQKRKRFFAVGILGEKKFDFPTPTHGADLTKFMTAWDALSGRTALTDPTECLKIKGRWANLLPSIPPGKNYLWHTNRGGGEALFGWRTRYWSFLYKLSPDEPSPTIVANPPQNAGPFHWENRLLSTAELAAIQTFPSGYKFFGERASRQRQIGNAVPPLLAEHIGKALMAQLSRTPTTTIRHAIKPAKGKPVVPLIEAVPPSFKTLIGNHADHPGTGLGPKPRDVAMPQLVTSP